MELAKIYGQLFITKNGSKDNGTWFEALNGLTPKALESGMERLRNLSGNGKFVEFPPNCLQFKALCVAFYEELRLPKVIDAYREVLRLGRDENPRWSSKLIGCIAKRMPDEFFLIEQEHLAYAVFKEVYGQVCEFVKQGHELIEPKEQHQVRRIPSRDIARTHLQQIKQHIGA